MSLAYDYSITAEEYADIISHDRLAFTEEVFNLVGDGEFVSNWHIECIVDHLQALDNGTLGSQNLIINMPPRSLKTICISIADSLWRIAHNPLEQIIAASYTKDIAVDINMKCLNVLKSEIFKAAFPKVQLSKESQDWIKTKYANIDDAREGHRKIATVGKNITGFGANIIYIDDPINPMGSKSDAERNTANNWITSTLFSRANNQYKIKKILVMQRLHEEDPTGLFLERGGWHHLSLPAIFSKKTTISVGDKSWTCEKGEYLSPILLGKEALDNLRRDMNELDFNGQYLQVPVPAGDGAFKSEWIVHYNNLSKDFTAKGMNIYIIVDPSSGKKTRTSKFKDPNTDYTSITVWGLNWDQNYYILDLVRDRLNPTERIERVVDLHQKWAARGSNNPVVGYEEYGMQSDIYYLKKYMSQITYTFNIIPLKGRISKIDRISTLIPLFENGRVFLPRSIDFKTTDNQYKDLVKEFINELLYFPLAKHDDMIDSAARITDASLFARFPKSPKRILRAAERTPRDTYRNQLVNGFKEDNFLTW